MADVSPSEESDLKDGVAIDLEEEKEEKQTEREELFVEGEETTVDQEQHLLDADGNEEEREASEDPDKIPWGVVVPLALLQIVEAFNANALFSYLPYMVVWFEMADTIDQAGYYGGPLAAAFYLGQFFSSFIWGMLSDKYGKRPILLFGSVGTLISVLAFGFAPNYAVGLIARFLGGLLNGNIGVAKALLGQIATKNTQTKLFGLFGICWGAGAVVASFYGGATAQLADKIDAFKGTIFETFPFLMPNLITAALSVAALISGYFYIYDPPGGKKGSISASQLKELLKSRQPMLTSLSYGLLGGVTTMMQELIPLWLAATPDRGGFSFDSTHVGYVNMFIGVFNILILLTVYTPIARRLGLRPTYRLGYLIIIPAFAVLQPSLAFLNITQGWKLWAGFVLCAVLRSFYGQFTFSTVFSLISNSVDDMHLLGSINGFAQSLVSIMRCLAPLVIAPLFAWSIAVPRSWPLNFWFCFGVIMLGHILLLVISLFFDKKLELPLKDRLTEEIELEKRNATSIDLEEEVFEQ